LPIEVVGGLDGLLSIMNAASPSRPADPDVLPDRQELRLELPVQATYDFNRQIFEEDRAIVEVQSLRTCRSTPKIEVNIPADRSSVAYRRACATSASATSSPHDPGSRHGHTALATAFGAHLPGWVAAELETVPEILPADDDRIRLTNRLADRNHRENTGGPFAALVVRVRHGTAGLGRGQRSSWPRTCPRRTPR